MAEGESGVPLVGSRISLISKKDIRYEGVLYNINTTDASLALQNVRSFGTENRTTDSHIAPSDKTFDFVCFRGEDIKDLHVHDAETEDVSQPPTAQAGGPPQPPQQPPPPPPPPAQFVQPPPPSGPPHLLSPAFVADTPPLPHQQQYPQHQQQHMPMQPRMPQHQVAPHQMHQMRQHEQRPRMPQQQQLPPPGGPLHPPAVPTGRTANGGPLTQPAQPPPAAARPPVPVASRAFPAQGQGQQEWTVTPRTSPFPAANSQAAAQVAHQSQKPTLPASSQRQPPRPQQQQQQSPSQPSGATRGGNQGSKPRQGASSNAGSGSGGSAHSSGPAIVAGSAAATGPRAPGLSQHAMVGTGEALLNVRVRGGQAGQAAATGTSAAASSEEFDFQGELQKFDKEKEFAKEMDGLNLKQASTAGGVGTEVKKYNKSSFFDEISCDVLDRAQGRQSRVTRAVEMDVNMETFGTTGLQHARRRGGRGQRRNRPGGGGGGGRGNGRGAGNGVPPAQANSGAGAGAAGGGGGASGAGRGSAGANGRGGAGARAVAGGPSGGRGPALRGRGAGAGAKVDGNNVNQGRQARARTRGRGGGRAGQGQGQGGQVQGQARQQPQGQSAVQGQGQVGAGAGAEAAPATG